MTAEDAARRRPQAEARHGRMAPIAPIASGVAVLMVCIGVSAQLPQDRCPESCGEVLKDCLEQSANRYKCIEVAERCLIKCRGTNRTGSLNGTIHVVSAGSGCRSLEQQVQAISSLKSAEVSAFVRNERE